MENLNRKSIRNDEVFQATAEYIPCKIFYFRMYTTRIFIYFFADILYSGSILRTLDDVRVVGGDDRLKVGKYIEL